MSGRVLTQTQSAPIAIAPVHDRKRQPIGGLNERADSR
jgi:hypothetical protein